MTLNDDDMTTSGGSGEGKEQRQEMGGTQDLPGGAYPAAAAGQTPEGAETDGDGGADAGADGGAADPDGGADAGADSGAADPDGGADGGADAGAV